MSKVDGSGPSRLSEMQALVDDLADALHRSVAVDNPRFELLCASAQTGPIDQIRVTAIIDRAPPEPPLPWMLSLGVATSTEPVRLPRNEDYGMLPRVCFPIRREGALLGYLWLFDEPPVTEPEMSDAGSTVSALAPLLASDDTEIRRRADELARLLTAATTRQTASAAVREALDSGHLPPRGDLRVHVAEVRRRRRGKPANQDNRDLELELARRRLARPFLARYTDDRLVTVSMNTTAGEIREVESTLTRAVHAAGYEVVGAGTAAADTADELEESTHRAQFAAELSSPNTGSTRFQQWEDLGSWRLLYGRPLRQDTVRNLSADADRLLRNGSVEHWKTVVAYLDAGRRVDATCEALSIHRATLYYRLNRIRELLGDQALDDGWRATALHVALKLHQHLADRQA
ncbi:helix-turn-helix domain-containing protein [Rhodococcus pseudokoreensis]|uniref:Helix-turn-helix domain-containing protein n=1 Tax=Rhodococcus pseudokoreensis TaxID=2811421 RepID=A0A974ZV96_9NOCA|nr:helix-turn-helix domain-containing protein [Rhodococcus pseudokoreensis]QSE91720.1 helix-turn-helix domain-containing protein [Rhodococcus pseudokoreensis]